MAFDKPTRNRLAAFVAEARRLITDEFTRQFQSLYGIAETSLTSLDQLSHLDDAGLAVAGLLRERIDYLVRTHPEDKAGLKTAVARLAREQAFTVLNRLAAVRMAEKRGLIIESVGSGYQSRGFKVFAQVARSGLGEIYQRYRRYLFCLFDELAVDLGVLFDRRSPQGLLFPGENTLLALLALLNGPELEPLWQEDETIGWIYQYYNDPAERKKMREESAAPRNSRELAVRNQFFTPRYVVEFLTDNTLGRIWYEMTGGETRLTEQCRHLVRRPTEIFLGPEETAPELPEQEGLNQEELLRQPVYIPHRALKDPRELRMLDPACGSMHFGLYAFDLYEVIYAEAWDRGIESLRADFPDRDALVREIPRLIIEHNIHGIDIDPRAVQIAGLSLWLRAQRSWQEQQLPARQRPQIRRSNIVCAEPMPGDKAMLRDFIASQFTPEEQPAFTFLLERVFDRMTLAGEAGSLLKIEEEISEAVREAKGLWQKGPQYTPGYLFAEGIPKQPEQLRLNLSGISDEGFWETAEERIYTALQIYTGQAESGNYQRRLFAHDAAQGFAFIDLCRKHYDAVVMNPPFGLSQAELYGYLNHEYPDSFIDLLAAFIVRGETFAQLGFIGAITSRACLYTKTLLNWRTAHMSGRISALADLGIGVLDGAMVRACAYVIPVGAMNVNGCFIDARKTEAKGAAILASVQGAMNGNGEGASTFCCDSAFFELIPQHRILYWLPRNFWQQIRSLPAIEPLAATIRAGLTTYDDLRFLRLRWEVAPEETGNGRTWVFLSKGGYFSTFYNDVHLVVQWANDGEEVGAYNRSLYDTDAQSRRGSAFYLRPAVTYSRRTDYFSARALPENCFFSDKGPCIIPLNKTTPAYVLGMFNADLLRGLVHSQSQGGCFETGVLKFLPWSEPDAAVKVRVETAAVAAWRAKSRVFSMFETDARFIGPILASGDSIEACHSNNVQAVIESNVTVALNAAMISRTVATLFGLSSNSFEDLDVFENDHEIKEAAEFLEAALALATASFSYILGTALGRWDIRYAIGARPAPEFPDPFAPLPICPPGMLQGENGLPLAPEAGRQLRNAGHYPLDIAWGGILVDDPGHPLDLEHRLREIFIVIWHDRAEAIEQEACEILGVKSLRDYFRKPSGFFAEHLKRYSKSRRQAPIYWPLSTAKGSYTLWIYYHRLSDQTLHTALADFVDPKLKDVRAEISLLREENSNRGRLEEMLDLEGELLDFRAEIERIIKLPWQPNLNDGVLITAAPLWPLFRLPKWRKDLKACWDKLEKGEYDWAHLAYTIWPKRVEEVCKTDRSIAIAHGLEHLCQVEPPKPKAKRGRKKAE